MNGYLQPFKVDGSENEVTFYFANMEGNEERTLKISFTPVIGSKGDVLTTHFVVMLRPDFIHKDKVTYGSYHSITQLQAWKLNINQDVPNKSEDLSTINYQDIEHNEIEIEDRLDKHYRNANETPDWATNNVNFNFVQDGVPVEKLEVERSKDVKLTLNGAGKNSRFACDKYRVSLYINHKLVPVFNGNTYCDVRVADGKQVDLPITIDTTGLDRDNFIYVYAVPILDEYTADSPIIEKSTTIGLIVN